MTTKRSGLTAFELIVVLLIVVIGGVLFIKLFVLVPREFESINDRKTNLKNLATACRTAEIDFGKLPPAWGEYGRPPKKGEPQRTASVFSHLLPHLENREVFDKGEFATAKVKVFLMLMDPSLPATISGHTSFVANLRVFSTNGADTKWNEPIEDLEKCQSTVLSTEKFADGAGNTLLFTTKYAVCNGTHNRFYLSPWDASNGGPYFGAGSHAGGPMATNDIPTGQQTKLPSYQISPTLGAQGRGVCNNDRGLIGHSFGSNGLAIVMGDTSVRNLSFTVTGDSFAKALCPNDGQKLGDDW